MENNGDAKPLNKPGVYKHPDSGAELTVRNHERFGSAQADAVVRAGFVYKGPEKEDKKEATK